MTEKVNLGVTQETLLIPLYGRAHETTNKKGILRDPKAVEMVDVIDYDFAKFEGGPSLMGVVLRTTLYDIWVRSFLDQHPRGTIVEVGCGLNTRYERVDNGEVHWIDLDLPDVMELRRKFFDESDRCRMLSGSILDPSWVDEVKEMPGPYFFAAEAVLPYLDEADVKSVVGLISQFFPGSVVALDTTGEWMVANQDQHDTLSQVEAQLVWACDRPEDLERWGLGFRLVESRDLSQLPKSALRGGPLSYRLLPLVNLLHPGARKAIGGYRINRYEVAGTA